MSSNKIKFAECTDCGESNDTDEMVLCRLTRGPKEVYVCHNCISEEDQLTEDAEAIELESVNKEFYSFDDDSDDDYDENY